MRPTHPGMSDEPPFDDPTHPLTRAHRFFQRATPAIRDAQETVVRTADELVQRIDHVVANATAIEGEVIEPSPASAPVIVPVAAPVTAAIDPEPPARRRNLPYIQLALIAAAATYGALRLQRRAR